MGVIVLCYEIESWHNVIFVTLCVKQKAYTKVQRTLPFSDLDLTNVFECPVLHITEKLQANVSEIWFVFIICSCDEFVINSDFVLTIYR